MRALNLAQSLSMTGSADAAPPQRHDFHQIACQCRSVSAIVDTGRTQAVFTSHKGAAQSTLPANKWSRGCRALKSPFWHFAWLLSLQLAPKKLKKPFTLTSLRFRPSQYIPANTSNLIGRVLLAQEAAPALFLSILIPNQKEGSAC